MKEEELQELRQRLGQMQGMICALVSGPQAMRSCDALHLLTEIQNTDNAGSVLALQRGLPHDYRQRWLTLERHLEAYLDLLQQRSNLLSQVSAHRQHAGQ